MDNSSLNNPVSPEKIAYYAMPDYSAPVSRSANTTYTAETNLIVMVNTGEGSHVNAQMFINDVNIANYGTYVNSAAWRNWWWLIPKGSTYRLTAWNYTAFPCIGG